MRKPKIGLLPLYVELYDITSPGARPGIEKAYQTAVKNLQGVGLDVLEAPVCRLADEFSQAIQGFEQADADAIVTLHLAYSPSLESEKALAATQLPLIILDTTPDYTYDQYTDSGALMYNHGIHGVQDMCNLLLRNGKTFHIFAGHMEHSDVLQRVAAAVKAAKVVKEMRGARVGAVGAPFKGMGDFAVTAEELKTDFGIELVQYDFEKAAEYANAVTQEQIEEEYAKDRKLFEMDPALPREIYDKTVPTSLAVRKWAEEEKLTAFTINFLETAAEKAGLAVMPFTECCKAMRRGIGYAGEGDVLTAAFVGALLQVYPETTFTEMFCPDWEHGSVFLSHMGEFNYNLADGKPVLMEKPFAYTSAGNTTAAYKTLKGGRATFVNLAPFGNREYVLSLVGGEMLEIKGENAMAKSVNGWFKPDMPLESCLEQLSQAGATHHSALVYGVTPEDLLPLADYLNCECNLVL